MSPALGMGPAVQAGVIVSTLVVCRAWSRAAFVSGASGQPMRPAPRATANLPTLNPADGQPAPKAVQEQGQQTNSKVPASFLLNAAEAERKAVTRQSGKTSALPDTPPNPANALKKTMAPSNSEEPNKENAFPIPASWPDHVTTRHSSRRESQPLFPPPLSGITIDGQLDDWPVAIGFPIDKLLVVRGVGTGGLADTNLATNADMRAAFLLATTRQNSSSTWP